jgi:benzylsuccinate CoA-transferase BbsF subunit
MGALDGARAVDLGEGVAAAPVLDVAGLARDPQFRARRTFIEVEHPLGFRETICGAYVKTSRTRAVVRPGPAMGRDDEAVFKELLGLSEPDYQRAIESGAIA